MVMESQGRHDVNPITTPQHDPDPAHLASPDGTFDIQEGGRFITAITDFIDTNRREDIIGDHDPGNLLELAHREPALVAQYFPLLQAKTYYKDILYLIDRAPSYARGLYGIFKEYPGLMELYRGRLAEHMVEHDFGKMDKQLPGTRISGSPHEAVIRSRLEENKRLYAAWTNKLKQYNQIKKIQAKILIGLFQNH
jgi:hypothetical protein